MAGTRRRPLTDWQRDKQRGMILMQRLEAHALSEKPEGIMSATQIQAAKIVLAKLIPDLKSVEIKGDAGGPVITKVVWESIEAPARSQEQPDDDGDD